MSTEAAQLDALGTLHASEPFQHVAPTPASSLSRFVLTLWHPAMTQTIYALLGPCQMCIMWHSKPKHLLLVDWAGWLAGKLALIANSPHSQPGALFVFPQRLTLTGSLPFLLGGQPPAVNLPPLPIILLLTGCHRPPSKGSMQPPAAGALQPLSPELHLTHWPAAPAQLA